MKRVLITLSILAVCSVQCVLAGGMEMKQAVAPAPCPEWYGDFEWNVNLWGTYVFTNTDDNPNRDIPDLIQSTSEGHTVAGSFDRYIGNDHAWGGGGDIKYFFYRYFGLGVEGFVLDAKKRTFFIDLRPRDGVFVGRNIDDERAVGAVLGTLTLRYPIHCSRFSPYAWAGFGAIFWRRRKRFGHHSAHSRFAERIPDRQRAEPSF